MASSRLACIGVLTVAALVSGCSNDWLAAGRKNDIEPSALTEVSASSGATIAPVSWQPLNPLPTGVRAAASALFGSRIYVLGGNAGFASPTATTRIFTPSTRAWSWGANFPIARDFAMASSLGDGIHLVGGANSGGLLTDHRLYVPSSNTWISRAPLPLAVDAAVARTVGGKLYVIGGGSASGPTGAVQVFNPTTNTWSMKRSMPTPRLSSASAVINKQIYVVGGQKSGITTTGVLERYNPAANTWTALASLPAAREALIGGNVGGQLCVSAGRLAAAMPTGKALAETSCYNPLSNSWTAGPNNLTPRAEAASAEFNGRLYAFGGRISNTYATRFVDQLSTGLDSRGLDFTQSFVQVPDNPVFDLADTWTLEAWINPRAAGDGNDQDIIAKWDGSPDASYILQIDRTGVIRLVTHDGTNNSIVLGQTHISNNVYQHIAATFESGTVRLYLDGVLDQTTTGSVVPTNSTQPVAFGREGNFDGGTLNGRIDEVRIWNSVRSAGDLAAYRTKRLSGSESGLVGYWRFDEASGQTAYDATGRRHGGQYGTSGQVDSWDPSRTDGVSLQ